LEHEGESSLSAQAAFANGFLEDAIINKPNGIDIAADMSSVLQSLRKALGRDSNQQELDYLYPHARVLESGLTLRNLPMPPVDKAFVCLRMAKGISHAFSYFSFPMLTTLRQKTPEFGSFGTTKLPLSLTFFLRCTLREKLLMLTSSLSMRDSIGFLGNANRSPQIHAKRLISRRKQSCAGTISRPYSLICLSINLAISGRSLQ